MSCKLRPQPGFVVVRIVEEGKEEGGIVKLESGLEIRADTYKRLQEDTTHLEFDILAVSDDSKLKVGDTAITTRFSKSLKVSIGRETFGLLPEIEVTASYTK